MVLRLFGVLVVAASFLGVPALCTGGVITHACDCAVEAGCDLSEVGCDCRTGCDGDGGCRHEGSCSDDPCNVRVVRVENTRHDDDAVSLVERQVPMVVVAVDQRLRRADRAFVFDGSFRGEGSVRLPFPPSDLPFLI